MPGDKVGTREKKQNIEWQGATRLQKEGEVLNVVKKFRCVVTGSQTARPEKKRWGFERTPSNMRLFVQLPRVVSSDS